DVGALEAGVAEVAGRGEALRGGLHAEEVRDEIAAVGPDLGPGGVEPGAHDQIAAAVAAGDVLRVLVDLLGHVREAGAEEEDGEARHHDDVETRGPVADVNLLDLLVEAEQLLAVAEVTARDGGVAERGVPAAAAARQAPGGLQGAALGVVVMAEP